MAENQQSTFLKYVGILAKAVGDFLNSLKTGVLRNFDRKQAGENQATNVTSSEEVEGSQSLNITSITPYLAPAAGGYNGVLYPGSPVVIIAYINIAQTKPNPSTGYTLTTSNGQYSRMHPIILTVYTGQCQFKQALAEDGSADDLG